MLFEEKKDAYARLVVTAGVHVRPGQKVFLGSSVEMYEFARLIVKYAYEAGASEVLVRYTDVVASRATYDHAPMEVFETVHPWEAEEAERTKKGRPRRSTWEAEMAEGTKKGRPRRSTWAAGECVCL